MEQRLYSDDRNFTPASKLEDFTPVVNQIVSDFQKLVRQELTLVKSEVEKDVVRGKNALLLFSGSLVASTLAFGFGLLALAQGMMTLGFPPGVAYLTLALLLVGVGVASYYLGKRWAQDIHLLPPDTTEAIKENVEWLRKPI